MEKSRIMVVEDEGIVAMDIKNTLKSLGYDVVAVAASGEEAIEKATETRPDLALMDIRLKGDMDGVEAAEKLNDRFDIPVVYLTAYSDEHTLHRAKVTEPFGYILKPFEKRELYTAVEMALYKHKMEVELRFSKESFHAIVSKSPDGIIIVDREGVARYVNPTAEVLLNRRAEELLGNMIGFPVVAGAVTEVDIVRKSGEPGIAEMRVVDTVWKGKISYLTSLRDVTEIVMLREKLRATSLRDELTGLYNRRGFFTLAEQQMRMADRTKKGMFLFFFDIDGLKWINDTLGHNEGDRVLIDTVEAVRKTLRDSDIIARIGGDEFAALAMDAPEDSAGAIAARLYKNEDAINAAGDRPYKLTISMGEAYYDPEHPCSVDELLDRADTAMYEEKKKRLFLSVEMNVYKQAFEQSESRL